MITELRFAVRSYECDSYNHVNNAIYLHYLEYARWEFLKDIGFDYNTVVACGYGVWVSRVDISYKKSAYADDELLIVTKPVKKGAVSGTIEQQITRGADVIAEAKVTWAFVDTKTGTPTRIPKEYDVPGLSPDTN